MARKKAEAAADQTQTEPVAAEDNTEARTTSVVHPEEDDSPEVAPDTEGVQVASEQVTVRLPENRNPDEDGVVRSPEDKLEVHATSSKPEDRQVVVADRRVTTNEDTDEEVHVRRSDVPSGKAKPVRIVNVRGHPDIDESLVGKKSGVAAGVYVGEQLSLEEVNRFHQRKEKIARGEEPLTRAELRAIRRRRGRSLR